MREDTSGLGIGRTLPFLALRVQPAFRKVARRTHRERTVLRRLVVRMRTASAGRRSPAITPSASPMTPNSSAGANKLPGRLPPVFSELPVVCSDEGIGGMDCCFADMEDMLSRYSRAIDELLAEPMADAHRFLQEEDELPINLKSLQNLATRWREDRVSIQQACDKYRVDLSAEQDRWLLAEAALVDSHSALQQQEMEAVVRRYRGGSGLRESSLLSAIANFRDQRLDDLAHCLDDALEALDDDGAVFPAAHEDWGEQASRAVVADFQQEWKPGHLAVVESARKELGAQRKYATEVYEKHVGMCEQVNEMARRAWNREVQRAQEELDQVNAAYKAALKFAMEAKLKETRRHAVEQADFFQREIKDAMAVEQAEETLHRNQLRRMRLAILKWHHDYMRDAKAKAKDVVLRRQGLRARDAAADLQSHGSERQNGEADADGLEKEDFEDGEEPKQQLVQKLRSCKKVLAGIWERLPAEEESARSFLERLEDAVPFTDEVLAIYEDYLEEHGLLPALHASDLSDHSTLPADDLDPNRERTDSDLSGGDKDPSDCHMVSRGPSDSGDRRHSTFGSRASMMRRASVAPPDLGRRPSMAPSVAPSDVGGMSYASER